MRRDRRRGHGWLPGVGLDWVDRGPSHHGKTSSSTSFGEKLRNCLGEVDFVVLWDIQVDMSRVLDIWLGAQIRHIAWYYTRASLQYAKKS